MTRITPEAAAVKAVTTAHATRTQQDEIDALEQRLDEARGTLHEAEREVRALCDQLAALRTA